MHLLPFYPLSCSKTYSGTDCSLIYLLRGKFPHCTSIILYLTVDYNHFPEKNALSCLLRPENLFPYDQVADEVGDDSQYPRDWVGRIQDEQRMLHAKDRKNPDDTEHTCANQRDDHWQHGIAQTAYCARKHIHHAAQAVGDADDRQALHTERDDLQIIRVDVQQMIAEQMRAVAEHQTDQCDDARAAHECLVDAVIILCTEILAGEADGGLIERVHRDVHKALNVGGCRIARNRYCAEAVDRGLNEYVRDVEDNALHTGRQTDLHDSQELIHVEVQTAQVEMAHAVRFYKASNRYALGTVIESKLDKNVGSTVTLLVQNGTLRLGDPIVVGTTYGKVRTLKDDLGREVVEALPSTPVEITGLSDVPSSGDRFMAFETEKEAKTIAENRKEQAKLKNSKNNKAISLDDLFDKIKSGVKEINVILKTDVKGTEEAVKNSLSKIEVEGVRVNVIRSGVGTITESDIVLANASDAIIIGFNVRPNAKTLEVAKEYNVDIRLHNIIYKLVEEMESAMKGMLDPEYEEKVIGSAEVRKLFKFSKVGTIAGCMVTDGVVRSNAKARLIRDGVVVYDGAINTIQKEKDQAKEVKKGFECGITLENYNDIKEKDVIEAYEMVEIKR